MTEVKSLEISGDDFIKTFKIYVTDKNTFGDLLAAVSNKFPGELDWSLFFGGPDKIYVEKSYAVEKSSLALSEIWQMLISPKIKVKSAKVQIMSETKIFTASSQGLRPTMEDEHLIKTFKIGETSVSLVGIFDGHGGSSCSLALKKYMDEEFLIVESMLENKNSLGKYLRSVNMLIEKKLFETGQCLNHGSTCLYALFLESCGKIEIIVSNVGDSRFLLMHGGIIKVETTDHKPCRGSELRRIIKSGGVVTNSKGVTRVNGILSVSRAHGCNDINFGLKFTNGTFSPYDCPVSCSPDIYKMEIFPNIKDSVYIFMACDGLWDVLTSREAKNLIVKFYNKGLSGDEICSKMVEESLRRGSKDNVTVLFAELVKAKITIRKQCDNFND